MKKTITVFLIIMLLINCISTFSYADEGDSEEVPSSSQTTAVFEDPTLLDPTPQKTGTADVVNDLDQKLEANVGGGTYSGSQIFKTMSNVILSLVTYAIKVLTWISGLAEDTKEVALTVGEEIKRGAQFTIYDTVMGNYKLFNIDLLGSSGTDETSVPGLLKENMIKFFNFTRAIAIAFSLFVLLYVAIKMITSTVASEKADYKRMLVDWAISLVLLFTMQYIIIIISVVIDTVLDVFSRVTKDWKIDQFELDIFETALKNVNAKGFNAFTALVMLIVIAYYQIKFCMYYIKRILEVYFLIIISPLVTVTYAIDKASDRKAQAFGALLGELISKLTIQPIHAILYVAFVSTAGAIAQSQPILAAVFFYAMGRSEKIMRKIFSVMSGKGDTGMSEEELPF